MRNLLIGTNNIKRLLGASLVLSLAMAVSVGATSTSGKIKSRGNIEYDSDDNGRPDVLFYSEDLQNISSGLNALDSQVLTLSSNYDELTSQITGYKEGIIKGLNSNVYANANLPDDLSFDKIIDSIKSIPAPSVAMANYYEFGDNSGLNVGLSSTNPNTEVNIDGVTTINLGVDESITLPSGYYPNDIVIQNSVTDRSVDVPDSGTISFNGTYAAGYYPEFSVDVSASNQIAALNAETMACSGGIYTCEAQKEILCIQKFVASSWGRVQPGEGPGSDNQYTHGWSCSGRLYIKRTDGTEETITQQGAGLYASGYYGYAVNGLIELNQGDQLIAEYRGYMPLPPWTYEQSNSVYFQAVGVRFK